MARSHGGVRLDPGFEQEFPSADRASTEAVINLLRTEGMVSARLSSYLRRFDLTTATFNVLMILRGAEGPLCPHEIGDRLLVTRGTVTGLLDSLERRGLIERGPHPDDRRMVQVTMTDAALSLLCELLPGHWENECDMLAGLSPREKATLVKLLGKLQATLDTA